jgi:hypothetical protein
MTTVTVPAHFADDVLHLLATRGAQAHKPSGTNAGELSLSDLLTCLRNGDGVPRRWTNLRDSGWNANFRDLLEAAGFTIHTRHAGRAVRNYVTV